MWADLSGRSEKVMLRESLKQAPLSPSPKRKKQDVALQGVFPLEWILLQWRWRKII